MNIQSPRTPTRNSFEIPTWESREKEPFECSFYVRCREYDMGEGGGFPQVRAVVSFVCQNAHGLS
jgi:hypothetical protein